MYQYRRCALGRVKNTKHKGVPFKNTGGALCAQCTQSAPFAEKVFFNKMGKNCFIARKKIGIIFCYNPDHLPIWSCCFNHVIERFPPFQLGGALKGVLPYKL